MATLFWTHAKPTQSGWYWRCYSDYDKTTTAIVQVRESHGRLIMDDWSGTVEAVSGQWAGPIDEPLTP